jgi:hypothetical protein
VTCGVHDFSVDRGCDQQIVFQIWDDAAQTAPRNLTGAVLMFRAARRPARGADPNAPPDILITKPLTVSAPASGLAALDLSRGESRALPVGAAALYEIEERRAGRETILARGVITGLGGLNADQ